jgi:hypothetical protein
MEIVQQPEVAVSVLDKELRAVRDELHKADEEIARVQAGITHAEEQVVFQREV